jgi:hypothetical protein
VLFKLKQDGLLEHYWFYGLQLPDQEAFGVEVRDNDGVLDDWLMDPEERYYMTPVGDLLVDFILSDMRVKGYKPSN